ncbi:MAG: response regulator transcription factor [Actinobacteria bacterium]|nr:response regulator transcription factor [Actinomycetota bacterium]
MKIIIIEDSKKLADILKKGLENEGYTVDCFYDGLSGEKNLLLHFEDYEIIILDVMLPGKNGLDICKNLRDKNISTPVLMLTAKDATQDKISGLDSGADDYLIKPFEFEELLARIRALLRRPVLNLSAKKTYRDGKEIILTLKEFRILEYMMRNAGIVLSRDSILGSLWDFDFDSFSNVVDVHMKNLRKKIDGNSKYKMIETVYGIGYRIKNA